jgi:hypothetical protein
MTPPARIEIQLELASKPIGGWLMAEQRPPQRFSGWLGLMNALERAAASTGQQAEADEIEQPDDAIRVKSG